MSGKDDPQPENPVPAPEAAKAAPTTAPVALGTAPENTAEKGKWTAEAVGKRFKKAMAEAEKGKGWTDKIINFALAFFSEMDEVSDEEKKRQEEVLAKAGQVILDQDSDDVAEKAIAPALTGGFEIKDKDEKEAVMTFASVSFDTMKKIDKRAEGKGKEKGVMAGKITGALDKVDPSKNTDKKKMSVDEQMALSSYGLQFLANLKDKYDTREEFEMFLDKFDKATVMGRGLVFMRNPATMEHLKTIFKPEESESFASRWIEGAGKLWEYKGKLQPLMDYADVGLTDLYGLKGSIFDVLKAGVLTPEAANALATKEENKKILEKFLPHTNFEFKEDEPSIAKFLQILSEVMSSDSKVPNNHQLACLAFAIHSNDLEKLSELLA